MMDYSSEPYGCCLNCPNAHPGCLCFECKCTKCEHYIPPCDWDGEHGKCDICLPENNEYSPEEKKAWAIANAPKVTPHIPFKREVNVKTVPFIKAFDKEGWTEV